MKKPIVNEIKSIAIKLPELTDHFGRNHVSHEKRLKKAWYQNGFAGIKKYIDWVKETHENKLKKAKAILDENRKKLQEKESKVSTENLKRSIIRRYISYVWRYILYISKRIQAASNYWKKTERDN